LVGIYVIDIANLPSPGLIPATLPVLDIFGNTPKFDPKTRFVRQNACATKEACNLYLNVNYAAGVGALPAWILDGKFSPTLTSRKQFFLSPLLAADIGNNTIKGQTYTNTIDIGGTAQRVFLPGPVLQALVVTLGQRTRLIDSSIETTFWLQVILNFFLHISIKPNNRKHWSNTMTRRLRSLRFSSATFACRSWGIS